MSGNSPSGQDDSDLGEQSKVTLPDIPEDVDRERLLGAIANVQTERAQISGKCPVDGCDWETKEWFPNGIKHIEKAHPEYYLILMKGISDKQLERIRVLEKQLQEFSETKKNDLSYTRKQYRKEISNLEKENKRLVKEKRKSDNLVRKNAPFLDLITTIEKLEDARMSQELRIDELGESVGKLIDGQELRIDELGESVDKIIDGLNELGRKHNELQEDYTESMRIIVAYLESQKGFQLQMDLSGNLGWKYKF